jgi:hypothetical protein
MEALQINMSKIFLPPAFQKMEVHNSLMIIKDSANQLIVGYVSKDIDEGSWLFVIRDFISDYYQTSDDAIQELCSTYITRRYDRSFEQMGLLNNEKYVKGR